MTAFTAAERDRNISMAWRYSQGETLQQIATAFGCSHGSARSWIVSTGVKMRPRGVEPGTRMAMSPREVPPKDLRSQLEASSIALLDRLWAYGASNGGLPNMTPEMCKERLAATQ